MAKYNTESVQELSNQKLLDEFIEAHKNSIASGNPDFGIIREEILRRLEQNHSHVDLDL